MNIVQLSFLTGMLFGGIIVIVGYLSRFFYEEYFMKNKDQIK